MPVDLEIKVSRGINPYIRHKDTAKLVNNKKAVSAHLQMTFHISRQRLYLAMRKIERTCLFPRHLYFDF